MSGSPPTEGSASVGWYEVRDVGFAQGGRSERSLEIGSTAGTHVARLTLNQLAGNARREGLEPYSWAGPQADGPFTGQVIVWGRDGQLQRIESVDLSDGTVEPLLEAPDAVHVATANRDLSRLYFITVDAGSNLPTGLWVDDVADDEDAREIAISLIRLGSRTDSSTGWWPAKTAPYWRFNQTKDRSRSWMSGRVLSERCARERR